MDAKAPPGPPAVKGSDAQGVVARLIFARNPDLTLEEHCEAFEEDFGVKVSDGHHEPRHLRVFQRRRLAAQKKSPSSPQSATRRSRGLWRWLASRFDAREAGVRGRERVSHLHDAPLRQGSERRAGLRQGPSQPRQERDADRLDHPRRSDGRLHDRSRAATDAAAFEAYVEHFLAPTLSGGAGGGARRARGAQDRQE